MENASIHSNPELFYNVLKPKLEKLKQEQDKQERLESALTAFNQTDLKSSTTLSMRSNLSTSVQRETQAHQKAFTAAIFKKFPQLNEDNDQDILDQHVSRVFSPHLSPGTISPCQMVASRPLPPLPHRALEPTTEISSTTGKIYEYLLIVTYSNYLNLSIYQVHNQCGIQNQFQNMQHQHRVNYQINGLQCIMIAELVFIQPIYRINQRKRG